MRIAYHNPIHQLNLLINQVLEEQSINPSLEVTILVSKDEMLQLVKHADARRTFPEHFQERDEQRRKLESATAKLHESKERKTTLQEREQVFAQISANEEQLHLLDTIIPRSLKSRGVQINVSLRS